MGPVVALTVEFSWLGSHVPAGGIQLSLGDWLNRGLIFSAIGGVVGGLVTGLRYGQIRSRSRPNQGIDRSGRYALAFGTFLFVVGGCLGFLTGRIEAGLQVGLILALGGGLMLGGFAYLLHHCVRLLLALRLHLPWNLRRFLSHAAFLRRTTACRVASVDIR